MPILKKKIRLLPIDETESEDNNDIEISDDIELKENNVITGAVKVNIGSKFKSKRKYEDELLDVKTESEPLSSSQATKIVRNYAKALCSFAYSELSSSFLKDIIEKKYKDSIELGAFQNLIRERKG